MPVLPFAGRIRSFEVHAPKSSKPLPLVLSLHGGGGNAAAHRKQTGLDQAADKYGFIAVYPEGTAGIGKAYTWNAGLCCGYAVDRQIDDVGFIRALLKALPRHCRFDPKRVYCCGMSNGAMMTYRLALELADALAGVCAVAAGMGADGKPSRAVPVMHVHGARDKNAPFFGGVGENAFAKIKHRPIWDTIYKWCEFNGCATNPTTVQNLLDHTQIDYVPKGAGAPIRLYVLPEGGHQWHGGSDPTPNFDDGKLVESFDTNGRMWAFFQSVS